jgi:hypothetical protein
LLEDDRRSLKRPMWHQIIPRGFDVLAPHEIQRTLKGCVCPMGSGAKGDSVLHRG